MRNSDVKSLIASMGLVRFLKRKSEEVAVAMYRIPAQISFLKICEQKTVSTKDPCDYEIIHAVHL